MDHIKQAVEESFEKAEQATPLLEPIVKRCRADVRAMASIIVEQMAMTKAQAMVAALDLLR